MRTSHFYRSIPSVKTHLRNLQVLNQYLCDFLCCEERFQVEKMNCKTFLLLTLLCT